MRFPEQGKNNSRGMHLFGVQVKKKKLPLLERPRRKFLRERGSRKGANDEGRENKYTNFRDTEARCDEQKKKGFQTLFDGSNIVLFVSSRLNALFYSNHATWKSVKTNRLKSTNTKFQKMKMQDWRENVKQNQKNI